MKVIWVVNKMIGRIAEEFNGAVGGFGGWMEQAFDEVAGDRSTQLVILTSGRYDHIIRKEYDNVTYYLTPGGDAYSCFCADRKENIKNIETVINQENPELIHIFGTESELGLVVSRCSAGIPKVVFLQGIMNSIYRSYYESTSRSFFRKNYTIHDIIKMKTVSQIDRKAKRKAKSEDEVLKSSNAIICDSIWCEAVCKAINPALNVYPQNLPIDSTFSNISWTDIQGQHRIFCASQYNTFKGFETLLRAIQIVKIKYPDVVADIPGGWNKPPKNFREKIRYDGYSKAMNALIVSMELTENINNIGSISRHEMAEYMAKTTIFVQVSTAENHSSTMREAMTVGAPCVVSNVGSVPEYVKHGENAFLFKTTDYEVLAFYIIRLFEDAELRSRFSSAARVAIKRKYLANGSLSTVEIYNRMMNTGYSEENC